MEFVDLFQTCDTGLAERVGKYDKVFNSFLLEVKPVEMPGILAIHFFKRITAPTAFFLVTSFGREVGEYVLQFLVRLANVLLPTGLTVPEQSQRPGAWAAHSLE